MALKIAALIALVLVPHVATISIVIPLVESVLCLLLGCRTPSAPRTDCTAANGPGPLEVYDLNAQKELMNPSVTYDFSSKQFRIYQNGNDLPFPRVAVINKPNMTVFFYDTIAGFITGSKLILDANDKAIGYKDGSKDYDLPTDQQGIYTVTTLGRVIPK